MAEGRGIDPLYRSIPRGSNPVCALRGTLYLNGTPGEIRTHTGQILSLLALTNWPTGAYGTEEKNRTFS